MPRALLLAGTAACTLAPAASTQTLIRDLRTGTHPTAEVRTISRLAAHGSGLLLTVFQEASGAEPWWSDGTPAGTAMLKDIASGSSHADPDLSVGLGGQVLFFATDTRPSLWRTDGTTGGTSRVAGPFYLDERVPPVVLGGVAYFLARSAWGGPVSLWRTDGTAAGTAAVATGFDRCGGLCRVGPGLFFRNFDRDLWRSDGTANGTALVRTFGAWTGAPTIGPIADLNGLAMFAADDGAGGRPLWISNGTATGTGLLLPPATLVASGDEIAVFQGRAYFLGEDGVAGRELWSTDGTAPGTSLVIDLSPGPADSEPGVMFAAPTAGCLFFSAGDWAPPSTRELYATDGTAAGTRLVDLGPGGNAADPSGFVEGNGLVLFRAGSVTAGVEPWASRGSTATTWMLGDLRPGTASSTPHSFARFGTGMAFLADDNRGTRLWTTDGTPANTRRITVPQPAAPLSSHPAPLANGGGTAWLQIAGPTQGGEIWNSDGTAAGTQMLVSLATAQTGFFVREMVRWRGSMIALLSAGQNERIVRIEDSGAVQLLHDFSQPGDSTPYHLRPADDRVYFMGGSSTGHEPWCTDGTPAGTRLIRDVWPTGSSMDSMRPPATFGNRLVFAGDDGVHGVEPWISDGTTAGTVLLADIRPGTSGSSPQHFCDMGSYVLFQANDPGHGGTELWRSDGTAAGTYLVADLTPTPGWGSDPRYITRVGDLAFFSALVWNDRELWRTDGTAVGTTLVFDLPNGALDPDQLVAARGKLFFRGFVPDQDRELWVSDGTPSGTQQVVDLRPAFGNGVDALVAAGSAHVVFRGSSPDTGAEAWVSDGTAGGTVPLADLVPGPGSSMPWNFLAAGGHLFWRAYEPDTGYELHGAPFGAFGGAMAEPYGVGCGSSRGTPIADVAGTAILGSVDVAWQLRRAAPSTLAFLLLDLVRGDASVGGGCRLLVGAGAPWVACMTDVAGMVRLPMPVPGTPSLAGVHLYGQFAVFEPGGPLAGMGTASQGLHLLIGR